MIFKYLFNYVAVEHDYTPVNLAAKGSRWKAKWFFRGQIWNFAYRHKFRKGVNIRGLLEEAYNHITYNTQNGSNGFSKALISALHLLNTSSGQNTLI